MQYKILNKDNIEQYVYTIDKVKKYFNDEKLIINEIGDGNLNYVFLLKSTVDETKTLILKQAVPFLRCLGEDFLLKRERMTYEIKALQNFKLTSPHHIPTLYDTNEDMSTVIMQYLDTHIILREGLINKVTYPNLSEHIAIYLSSNLFKTSSLNLSSVEKRELMDDFNTNSELCSITEDYVFTFAFMEHDSNDPYSKNNEEFKALVSNMDFKKGVLKLKYKYMTQSDALLHGDFHTGSVMINKNETFVIDPEFSFIGPFGFDIGAILGNLTMSYISHRCLDTNDKYTDWLLTTIQEVLEKFEEKFLSLWNKKEESALLTQKFIDDESLTFYKQEFMLNILKDSVGFAGVKMARRMFGAAGVADIKGIEYKKIKDKAIHATLNIAKQFVIGCEDIKCVEDVINIVRNCK